MYSIWGSPKVYWNPVVYAGYGVVVAHRLRDVIYIHDDQVIIFNGW